MREKSRSSKPARETMTEDDKSFPGWIPQGYSLGYPPNVRDHENNPVPVMGLNYAAVIPLWKDELRKSNEALGKATVQLGLEYARGRTDARPPASGEQDQLLQIGEGTFGRVLHLPGSTHCYKMVLDQRWGKRLLHEFQMLV